MMVLPKSKRVRTAAVVAAAAALVVGGSSLTTAAHATDANGIAPESASLIHNVRTDMCVDIPGFGPGKPGGPVNQWYCQTSGDNQYFTFESTGTTPEGNGLFRIRNITDGLCLDLPGTGSVPASTPVSENPCLDGDNQDWYNRLAQPGDAWYLVNYASGLCLDVAGVGDGGPDARIGVYPCQFYDDHEWYFE